MIYGLFVLHNYWQDREIICLTNRLFVTHMCGYLTNQSRFSRSTFGRSGFCDCPGKIMFKSVVSNDVANPAPLLFQTKCYEAALLAG